MPFTKPSKRYDAELRQVRDAADELTAFLSDQPNMLPIGFPSDAVITMGLALRQLPEGSVEGSVLVLEAGRDQCPTIRRNYIPPEISRDDPDFDPDAPPVFRGGELDVLINDLYVAIGTAIDAFKAEYGEGFIDTIEIDPPVAARPEFVLDAAIENSRKAELEIADFSSQNEASIAANDELKRGLVDTDSDLKIARSTAAMPEPKPNLLSRIGETVSKAPEALKGIGKGAQVFADVAGPVVKAGAEIVVGGWQAALDAIRTAGEGIEESGRRLAAWRDQTSNLSNEATEESLFETNRIPFKQLDAINLLLRGLSLPDHWYDKIEKLELGGRSHAQWKQIKTTCTNLAKCRNLKYLDMSSSPLENTEFLSSLKSLRELRLSGTKIQDVSGIGGLEKLRILHLNGVSTLVDINAIGASKRLTSLQIRNTNVRSLEPLLNLEDLEILIVGEGQFSRKEMETIENTFPAIKIQNKAVRRRRRRGGANN